jgi:peptide/nickel transport system ATP-binding protein
MDEYAYQLSGGLRQCAMIATALCCGPRILIADEPTTALDVTTQAQILALLRELQARERMAIMLITHNLGVVAEMCDEVAWTGRRHLPLAPAPVHASAAALDPLGTCARTNEAAGHHGLAAAPVPASGRLPVPSALRRGDPWHVRAP